MFSCEICETFKNTFFTEHIFCLLLKNGLQRKLEIRGGSRTVATSKMERFVIIINGWKLLNFITKRSVAAVLDLPLEISPAYMTKVTGLQRKKMENNALLRVENAHGCDEGT